MESVYKQLAADRGKDADCWPLNLHGARGALLKLRLSSHGYVFVVKGVPECDSRHLRDEAHIYQHLRPVQGIHVHACCGIVCLLVPYIYGNVELTNLLILSWAGRFVLSMQKMGPVSSIIRDSLARQKGDVVAALHKLCVQHGDLEERNMTYDDRLMLKFATLGLRARSLSKSKLEGNDHCMSSSCGTLC